MIVAFRDAEATLAQCLRAISAQQLEREGRAGADFEVLAVDNGSVDRSSQIAAEIAAEQPRLHVLTEPRQGAYHARNHAISRARGDVLVFTDADCVPVEDWLQCIVGALRTPGVRVVMGRDRPAGPGRAVRLLGAYDHCKEALVLGGSRPEFYYGHTNNLATTRSTLAEVGGFDPRPRGGDVIFVQQVLQRHGTPSVRYEPAAQVEHLEIESARVYYRKAVIYGRSARRYSKVVPARPLTARLRWRSFRRTVEENRLGLFDRTFLFTLLLIGALAYEWGWLVERWSSGPGDAPRPSTDDDSGARPVKPRSASSQDSR